MGSSCNATEDSVDVKRCCDSSATRPGVTESSRKRKRRKRARKGLRGPVRSWKEDFSFAQTEDEALEGGWLETADSQGERYRFPSYTHRNNTSNNETGNH